jgi:hypothetical protein
MQLRATPFAASSQFFRSETLTCHDWGNFKRPDPGIFQAPMTLYEYMLAKI